MGYDSEQVIHNFCTLCFVLWLVEIDAKGQERKIKQQASDGILFLWLGSFFWFGIEAAPPLLVIPNTRHGGQQREKKQTRPAPSSAGFLGGRGPFLNPPPTAAPPAASSSVYPQRGRRSPLPPPPPRGALCVYLQFFGSCLPFLPSSLFPFRVIRRPFPHPLVKQCVDTALYFPPPPSPLRLLQIQVKRKNKVTKDTRLDYSLHSSYSSY